LTICSRSFYSPDAVVGRTQFSKADTIDKKYIHTILNGELNALEHAHLTLNSIDPIAAQSLVSTDPSGKSFERLHVHL
jgi:hypothetical protein